MTPAISTDSKAIFKQLGELPPGAPGVHTVIENHDAWLHSSATSFFIDIGARAELQHRAASGPQSQQIRAQRSSLHALVTTLPARLSHAS